MQYIIADTLVTVMNNILLIEVKVKMNSDISDISVTLITNLTLPYLALPNQTPPNLT